MEQGSVSRTVHIEFFIILQGITCNHMFLDNETYVEKRNFQNNLM